MHTARVLSRTGLTLLEVLVALVILGLVGTGFLEAFAGALRITAQTRDWAQALVYAELGQESIKAGDPPGKLDVPLGGGFTRHVTIQPWRAGVNRATVTVVLPGGEQFELNRLVPAR